MGALALGVALATCEGTAHADSTSASSTGTASTSGDVEGSGTSSGTGTGEAGDRTDETGDPPVAEPHYGAPATGCSVGETSGGVATMLGVVGLLGLRRRRSDRE